MLNDINKANIIHCLKENLQNAIEGYEAATQNEVFIIGGQCLSVSMSRNYGNSYFDYGLAIRLNIFDKTKVILNTKSEIIDWLSCEIVEILQEIGWRWMYLDTKNIDDITSFYYNKYSIKYLKRTLYYKFKKIHTSTKYFKIPLSCVDIQKDRIFVKK